MDLGGDPVRRHEVVEDEPTRNMQTQSLKVAARSLLSSRLLGGCNENRDRWRGWRIELDEIKRAAVFPVTEIDSRGGTCCWPDPDEGEGTDR